MKHGQIKCICGQDFYFETFFDSLNCIVCGLVHDTSQFPELVQEDVNTKAEIEEVPNGEEVQPDS